MMNQYARFSGLLRRAGLAMAFALLALSPAVAQQSVDGTRFEGIISVVWGDPRPGRTGGETRFSITLPDDTKFGLDAGPEDQNAALRLFGKPVVVEGRQSRSADGKARIAASRILAGAGVKEGTTRAAQVRRVLYVLLKFKGDDQEPHRPSFYKALTNPLTVPSGSNVVATLNGFFSKTSWNNLTWRADVVGQGGLISTQWLRLPKTKTGYAPCGWDDECADLDAIRDDGLALAAATGVDLTVYDNINFVLNNDLDCCAWGGDFVYKGKSYGATWEPPWGQEAGTYAHELGHSIGLPHSGWVYYAYDSPWDEMSRGSEAKSVQCGLYASANNSKLERLFCTEPGSGYIAAHKEFLGWLPRANIAVISIASTRTIILEANALPLGPNIKMIKVCYPGTLCTGPTAQYLTIEARVTGAQFENGLPGDGVIIHDFKADRAPRGDGNSCFFNAQSGWAVPIDATRGDYRGQPTCDSGGRDWPAYGLGNAQFLTNRTYTNTARHITVRVNQRTGSRYSVTVIRTQ